MEQLIDYISKHEVPENRLSLYEVEEYLTFGGLGNLKPGEKIAPDLQKQIEEDYGYPNFDEVRIDGNEFLQRLNEILPNLVELSLTSRHGSDGPWDYGFEPGMFLNLRTLEVEFFTGPMVLEFVRTHPRLNRLEIGPGGRVREETHTVPSNIKHLVFTVIDEEQLPLADFKRIIGKNRVVTIAEILGANKALYEQALRNANAKTKPKAKAKAKAKPRVKVTTKATTTKKCKGKTLKGTKCKNNAQPGRDYCRHH